MNSVYVTSSPLQVVRVTTAWLGALAILVVLEFTGLIGMIHRVLGWGVTPLASSATRVVQGIEWPVGAVIQFQSAARRLQQLENQYAQAIADLSRLEGVDSENKELKRLLENTDRTFRETRVAGSLVSLVRPAVSLGKEDGIQVGNEVLVQNILIGTVSDVTPSISFISLLSQSEHPAVLAITQEGTQGVVRGTGRSIILDEVALDSPLEIGDRVVTSGQAGIAKDLVIGQVVRVIKDPASPVKKAQIEQIVDFYQTRIVEVLL